MGTRVYTARSGGIRDHLAKFGVALVAVGQVFDEVRQFVAGVKAFKMRCVVYVVTTVDQPVGVEHNNGINAAFPASTRHLPVPVDGVIPATLVRAVLL